MNQQPACLELDAVFWDENDWEELLAYIEDGRVIPIVGPDLLDVDIDGKQILLGQYVGSQLTEKFALPEGTLTDECSLNEVVCQLMDRRSRLYPAIASILQKSTFATPKPLRQLAEISHFRLFVSTTFDLLMEQALNEVVSAAAKKHFVFHMHQITFKTSPKRARIDQRSITCLASIRQPLRMSFAMRTSSSLSVPCRLTPGAPNACLTSWSNTTCSFLVKIFRIG